jgi:hypothetical protein
MSWNKTINVRWGVSKGRAGDKVTDSIFVPIENVVFDDGICVGTSRGVPRDVKASRSCTDDNIRRSWSGLRMGRCREQSGPVTFDSVAGTRANLDLVNPTI